MGGLSKAARETTDELMGEAMILEGCLSEPRAKLPHTKAMVKARLGPAYVGLSSAGLGLQAGLCTTLCG
jgi:hypothetical protein